MVSGESPNLGNPVETKKPEAGPAGWTSIPEGVTGRKFRASPHPGRFAGNKKAAAVGRSPSGSNVPAETLYPSKHGERWMEGVPNISDT